MAVEKLVLLFVVFFASQFKKQYNMGSHIHEKKVKLFTEEPSTILEQKTCSFLVTSSITRLMLSGRIMSEGNQKHKRTKGIARAKKDQKREEAEARNALTPPERTRAYRRGMEEG